MPHCPTVDHRSIVRLLAAGRIAIGTAALLAPSRVTRGWVGPDGATPGGRTVTRGLGARDVALGLGVLDALERGEPSARRWVQASALADLGDATATLAAFRQLPKVGRLAVLAVAAGAAVAGMVAADNLD